MNVSKMNHAMLSFALMGGMLVGPRTGAPPKPQRTPSRPQEQK